VPLGVPQTYKTITDDVIDSVLSEVDPSQLGLNEKQCESMKKLVDTAKREELEKEVRRGERPAHGESCGMVSYGLRVR
jgi:hypothetical protein